METGCAACARAGIACEGVLADVHRVARAFVERVYGVPMVPARAAGVWQRIPQVTFTTLAGYVEGGEDFASLARVFSVGTPTLLGIYFPDPTGDGLARWPDAMAQAIEALVAVKIHRQAPAPAPDRRVVGTPTTRRARRANGVAGSGEPADDRAVRALRAQGDAG